ncbi:MAG: hypothetical protein KDC98_26685 [Planctomycetes bacterium]|nr:hypothetical protein [Planctomycetota bacterium]
MSDRVLRRGNWSVQELERLRQLLPRRGVKATATLLRRTPDSVYRKAMEIMRVQPRRGAWSEESDALLRQAWGVVDRRLLAAIVGRPMSDVTGRAALLRRELSTGPWSRAERLRLKELFGTRSDDDLVVSLQRSKAEIQAMAGELCLAKDKRYAAAARLRPLAGDGALRTMPRWTRAQVEKLRSLYATRDNLDIARQLGRTVASVANKANQLGLRKGHELLARIGRTNVNLRYSHARGGSSADDPGSGAVETQAGESPVGETRAVDSRIGDPLAVESNAVGQQAE